MTSTLSIDLGRVVPIVTIDDPAAARDLALALLDGGITSAEVTLRTPAGMAAISAMSDTGIIVGAGTVLTADDVKRASDAGAHFIVSPGFDEEVVARTVDLGRFSLPGIATPTELQRAIRVGLTAVKVFPVTQLGGAAFVASLNGPFPTMTFMPSGGITLVNAIDYLSLPFVTSIGVSWIASRAAIANHDFEAIQLLAQEASAL